MDVIQLEEMDHMDVILIRWKFMMIEWMDLMEQMIQWMMEMDQDHIQLMEDMD